MNLWSRLGLSVALAAMFCIIIMEAFQGRGYYQTFKWYAGATFAVAGVGLVLLAWRKKLLNWRRRTAVVTVPGTPSEVSETSHATTEDAPGHSFWGPILMMFAVIVFFIPYRDKTEVVEARATRATEPPKPPPPAPPPVEKEVSFPNLNIQGVVYRPPNPAVIISGKSYFVGDSYEDAEIVAIDAHSVTLELNGQKKVYMFAK